MSLERLIHAALGECNACTIKSTTGEKSDAHSPTAKVNDVHIRKMLTLAIKEYCELSQSHTNVQALIDDCLAQPEAMQVELLEHFEEQVIAWRAVHSNLNNSILQENKA